MRQAGLAGVGSSGGGPSAGGPSGGGPGPGTDGFLQIEALKDSPWELPGKNLPVGVELASWAILGFHAHQIAEFTREHGRQTGQ